MGLRWAADGSSGERRVKERTTKGRSVCGGVFVRFRERERLLERDDRKRWWWLGSSGIEIIIGLNNGLVKDVGGSEDRAMTWVKENVEAFVPGTKIRGVAVGNEILGSGDEGLMEALLPAVKNVYTALERLNLAKQIEVSSPHSAAVFADSLTL